ncbi:hypothetical protein BD779DRAFT_1788925 [Infundibulicybe gibba]|nr:hypothetical protein BD779DRAFT_1788925 [Infundibulicybe gibba]
MFLLPVGVYGCWSSVLSSYPCTIAFDSTWYLGSPKPVTIDETRDIGLNLDSKEIGLPSRDRNICEELELAKEPHWGLVFRYYHKLMAAYAAVPPSLGTSLTDCTSWIAPLVAENGGRRTEGAGWGSRENFGTDEGDFGSGGTQDSIDE